MKIKYKLTMEYHSVTEEIKIVAFVTEWMWPENIKLNKCPMRKEIHAMFCM